MHRHLRPGWVRDPHPDLPVESTPDDLDESGRGLLIVRTYADAFGVKAGKYDKTIIVVFLRPGCSVPAEVLDGLVS